MANVLVIDKDALHLELLTFLLKQEGHQVHATPNPDIGFDILLQDVAQIDEPLQELDRLLLGQRLQVERRGRLSVKPLRRWPLSGGIAVGTVGESRKLHRFRIATGVRRGLLLGLGLM